MVEPLFNFMMILDDSLFFCVCVQYKRWEAKVLIPKKMLYLYPQFFQSISLTQATERLPRITQMPRFLKASFVARVSLKHVCKIFHPYKTTLEFFLPWFFPYFETMWKLLFMILCVRCDKLGNLRCLCLGKTWHFL